MNQAFETWGLVELMGHNRIAGRITEQKFGNESMLRIDVPECGEIPAFTKLVAIKAIYAINPLEEAETRALAKTLFAKPLDSWQINELLAKKVKEMVMAGRLQLVKSETDEDDEDSFYFPFK